MLEDLDLREPVMVYDGVCNFCDASVRFIIARDPAGVVTFVPGQSPLGAELQRRAGVDMLADDTVMVFDAGRVFIEGKAATRLWRHLRWPWRAAGIAHLLPAPILDVGYRIIARHRYQWFGKADACIIPSPAIANRFREELPARA